jgi:hypothetical protein
MHHSLVSGLTRPVFQSEDAQKKMCKSICNKLLAVLPFSG